MLQSTPATLDISSDNAIRKSYAEPMQHGLLSTKYHFIMCGGVTLQEKVQHAHIESTNIQQLGVYCDG